MEGKHSARTLSLGTEKCVQISTYILVQHLSCVVLFCILGERLQKKMWLLSLPSCLIALRNNGKRASLEASEHGDK